jgi:hypothetical protein
MFRRSGHRFADKNTRQIKEIRAYSDSAGTEYALSARLLSNPPGDKLSAYRE